MWNKIKTYFTTELRWAYVVLGVALAFIYALAFGLMNYSFIAIVIITNIAVVLSVVTGIVYQRLSSGQWMIRKALLSLFIPAVLDLFLLAKFLF